MAGWDSIWRAAGASPECEGVGGGEAGAVLITLPSYVAASSNQRIMFISNPGKYVRSLTRTEPTVCECDLVHFCGAAGHLDMQRTAGARLAWFWSWLSWVGGKFTSLTLPTGSIGEAGESSLICPGQN